MKLGQPRENHPFDLITHHLSEIVGISLIQRITKVLVVFAYLLRI